MAGYMRKLQGHVYDGAHIAAEELTNGLFVEINAEGKVAKTAAAKDTVLRVAEQTELWGMPAIVADVVSVGADEVFFVENEWEIYRDKDYNTAEYAVPAGHYVKMHRPLPGEQLIFTVTEELYATLTEGKKIKPAADGTVVAAA